MRHRRSPCLGPVLLLGAIACASTLVACTNDYGKFRHESPASPELRDAARTDDSDANVPSQTGSADAGDGPAPVIGGSRDAGGKDAQPGPARDARGDTQSTGDSQDAGADAQPVDADADVMARDAGRDAP